jgi:osmoprotectant transport system ATP-binding protein
MDEPFSALDPITRAGLQDELASLQAKLKKTIVFVTHDMDEAIKVADKLLIMSHGSIVQYDTPENILKNPANDFVSHFVGKNRIWTSPEFIKAEDIMIEDPVTCTEDLTLFRCMERMRMAKVDSLMVVDEKTRVLKGIVKAYQLRLAEDKAAPVGRIMKRDFPRVSPGDTIVDILKIVNQDNLSTIPVVSPDGVLKGLITRSSLVTTLSHQYIGDMEGEESE